MIPSEFCVNGHVISFLSQLIMITFILFSLRERLQAGYALPRWVFHIYGLLALDALLAGVLTGLELNNSDLFFAARRAVTLFSILFIFLAIFDFPDKHDSSSLLRGRRQVIIFVYIQVAVNISWLFLSLYAPGETWPSILRYTSHALLSLNFLWMALLVQRRWRSLHDMGEQETALLMNRFGWIFWLGMAIAVLPILGIWLPIVVPVHATASSYGWLIVCAGSALIFLGFRRNQRLTISQLKLVTVLVLLLALGLVAELVTLSLGNMLSTAEMNRIMLQFILAQISIVLLAAFALPRWLGHLLPEEIKEKISPLTSRQREIMQLLAEDLSNGQIAAELHLTEHTVKYHVSRLMRQQGKENRYELGELAREMLKDNHL